MKILADASLPNIKKLFPKPFSLKLYENLSEVKSLIANFDVLLCRSTLKVDESLLANSSIKIVATASSGVDHIDKNYLDENNILLIDAKGSNAIAVCDYVIASIAYLQKNQKLLGLNACIVGFGEVGSRLLPRLSKIGFNVRCFDPFLKIDLFGNSTDEASCFVDAVLESSCTHVYTAVLRAASPRNTLSSASFRRGLIKNLNFDLHELQNCDLICIHANLHEIAPFPSRNLFNNALITKLKPGVVIINAARGGIVNEDELLKSGNRITYCTDVYSNEPDINAKIVDYATLCTPHIAGHSIEAKIAAVSQVCEAIYAYYGVDRSLYQDNLIDSNVTEALKKKSSTNTVLLDKSSWQDEILKLYNPHVETLLLKQAVNKKESFIKIRLDHKNRHDFNL